MTPLLFSVRIPTLLAIFWRKWLARTAEASANPRSIIMFRLDQLGDVVLTTPLFRELKRMYPTARCTAVVQPAYRAILTTNHSVDEILPLNEVKAAWLPARALRLVSALWFYWTRLKGRRFDLAISPRWDVDESLATMLCVLTNAGRRVGHSEQTSKAKRRVNRGFDGAFDVMAPPGPVRHEVDRNLAIIEALGGRVEDRRLEICLTANDRKFASELLTHHESGRTLVAIGIGGRAASRRWPLKSYTEMIARLNQRVRVQPILVCAREEEAEAEKLAELLVVPPYILSGVPLRAACAVLERCDLFVGNDSGMAHLAAAMDCPTVVVSRHPQGGDPDHANSPARFAPRCSRYRVVRPALGAGDCTRSCGATEPHCIKLVTVEMAVSAALELLCLKPPLAIQQASSSSGILPAVVHVADEVSVPQAAGAL
jgi:ADP-heptose:LPS heptosyltransferase